MYTSNLAGMGGLSHSLAIVSLHYPLPLGMLVPDIATRWMTGSSSLTNVHHLVIGLAMKMTPVFLVAVSIAANRDWDVRLTASSKQFLLPSPLFDFAIAGVRIFRVFKIL